MRSGTAPKRVLLVLAEGHRDEASSVADHVLEVPSGPDLIYTVTSVVPLQVLAYQIASAKGLDVDKPRNLAKTVTVE